MFIGGHKFSVISKDIVYSNGARALKSRIYLCRECKLVLLIYYHKDGTRVKLSKVGHIYTGAEVVNKGIEKYDRRYTIMGSKDIYTDRGEAVKEAIMGCGAQLMKRACE